MSSNRQESERYLTVEQVCELTHSGDSTVRQWVRDGKLTAYKPGKRVLIPEHEVRALVLSRRVGAAQ